MNVGSITWDVARTGGLIAFVLLTASVAIGLLLSLGWRSPTWTRFVTNEVHRFVTLLSLVFIGIHSLAVAIDPFVKLSPPEVLVPFLSSYRPIWVALGIIATYLMIAIYLSDRLRARVGYAWWRRFHVLAFVAYVMALVHGIATGSDTRAIWGMGLYITSVAVVGGLLFVRLFPGAPRPSKPFAAALGMASVLGVAAFTFVGPLAPGWSTRAGGTVPGATPTAAVAGASTAPSASPTPAPADLGLATGTAMPFTATLRGSDDGGSLDIQGQLSDGSARFQIQLAATADGSAAGPLLLQSKAGVSCSGSVTSVDATGLTAACQAPAGAYSVRIELAGNSRRLTGTLTLAPTTAPVPSPGAVSPQPPSGAGGDIVGRGGGGPG